jgi:hypothetical protein
MKGSQVLACDRNVGFFGRVSASFTHEIKNRLATISESVGVLGDLLDLAEDGRPLDLSELQSCRQALALEIGCGFDVVRTFNRFAHSADKPIAEVDVGVAVDLVARLVKFQSFASEILLDPAPGDSPKIETRPLALECLLYDAMLAACKSVGPDGQFSVSVRPRSDGSVVTFKGWMGDNWEGGAAAVSAQLGAQVASDRDRLTLSIYLPAGVDLVEES